jgi:pimeloyl-ACP methyl ester carboxylesterase
VLVDLVRVTTSDGVRLDGALQTPMGAADPLPIDACLLVHGTGSNFYGATLLETLSARMLELGVAVLSANTRGHDGISIAATSEGPRRQGAAYERVDDCRHDLAAWIELLSVRGYQRVVLIGHSLGAVKAIYTMALAPHAAVVRLAAISPPRLSHAWFAASAEASGFLSTLAEAEQHVREGRGERLMEVRFPLPYVVTAAGYLDKYGDEERYNILRHLGQLPCPTLATFGSREVQTSAAFAGLPEAIESLKIASTHVAVVAGADHVYSGCRSELCARLEAWLRRA